MHIINVSGLALTVSYNCFRSLLLWYITSVRTDVKCNGSRALPGLYHSSAGKPPRREDLDKTGRDHGDCRTCRKPAVGVGRRRRLDLAASSDIPISITLAHVHVLLRVAREIIAFLSVTISEMRCGISCLALRRSAIYVTVLGIRSAQRPCLAHAYVLRTRYLMGTNVICVIARA